MIKFSLLTKAQRAIMDALCKGDLPADHIKPATLGALCAKKMADVKDGMVRGRGIFAYSMHKAMANK